jgi:hypothetical protein
VVGIIFDLVDHVHPGPEHLLIGGLEAFGLVRLTRKGTDNLHAHDIFLQTVRDITHRVIHIKEQFSDLCPKTRCHQGQRDDRQQGNDGEPGIIHDHDRDDPHRKQYKPNEISHGSACESLDRTDILDTA